MKIISMHKVDAAMEAGAMPSKDLIQNMGRLMGEMRNAGALVDGAGLRPSHTRVRLRFSGGERSVQQGPYPGGNELPAGMAMLKTRDMDEAVEWASRYGRAVGDSEVEIGPVTEYWDLGVGAKPADAPLRTLLLHKADAAFEAGQPLPAPAAAALAKVQDDMRAASVLLLSERLKPSREGLRIQVKNKRQTVTDGPFAESKELIAGYVILELPSLDAARPWANKFADVLGDVEMDLRVIA
jgi:hypothetical protein